MPGKGPVPTASAQWGLGILPHLTHSSGNTRTKGPAWLPLSLPVTPTSPLLQLTALHHWSWTCTLKLKSFQDNIPTTSPCSTFNLSEALIDCRKGSKSLALALVSFCSLKFFLCCEVYSSGQFETQSGRSSTHTAPSHAPSSPLPGIPPFIFPCLNVNVL